jgi:hypothetical protein
VVEFHDDFAAEVAGFPETVRLELLATARLIEEFGPTLGRPHVDTLAGSRIPKLKELRFSAGGGIWRIAFAFNRRRVAILLAGGNKSGVSEARFYRNLIARAERRYEG